METRFKWPFSVLVAVPLMLVAHALPCKPLAQSKHPSTTHNAVDRPSNEHDDWARAAKILRTANSWRTGDPLPPELRRFRKSEIDIPGPMDNLIAQVSNLPLLAALVVDPGADPECREDALSQGVEAGGPSRFFDLLRPQLSTAAGIQPWVNEVRDRMSRPHAVADALFIRYEDMPSQQAVSVIGRITNDLRRGVSWPKVYKEYSEEFGYKTGNRTKIGLYGRLVVFPDPALGSGHMSQGEVFEWQGTPLPRRLGGLEFFDPAHLPTLLKASVGDVISLPSEQNHEYVLYQVQEIYKGNAENRPQ